ncbi:MAG: transglutaminase-like domain-containing protein [Spirochaetia bacterium]|nr:transglutaminase-like domain-containing protein [Spirochaetia bacterium]
MFPERSSNHNGMNNLFLSLLDNPSKRKNSILLLLDMIPFGHHPLPYMERIEDPVARNMLRHQFGSSMNEMKLRYDLQNYTRRAKGRFDLETGAFLISRLSENPEITPEKFTYQIDKTAASLNLSFDRMTLDVLEKFSDLLFNQNQFRGNAEDPYNPQNSFLTAVLEKGLGNSVSLTVLSILLGKRLGIQLCAISLQGHYMIRAVIDNQFYYMDPFCRGKIYTEEEFGRIALSEMGKKYIFQNITLSDIVILKRMYRNLIHYHSSEGDFHREMTLRQYFSLLEDSSLSH